MSNQTAKTKNFFDVSQNDFIDAHRTKGKIKLYLKNGLQYYLRNVIIW